MGKADNQRLPVVQQPNGGGSESRTFLCRRCAVGLRGLCSVKCAVVLIISIAAFFSAVFWLLPVRYREAGFDAQDSIKLSATVQSYFKLQKPVHELVPYVARLEYDVNEEIGVPSLKVAVLSMHKAKSSNYTDVVFGFHPDPINSTMNPVALSLLRSSLIDLFLHQYNLTLTSAIFGEPFSFEILEFPGGITIIPERAALISQPLVNFSLNSSIYDIKQNLPKLKEQLKLGLHLMPNEVVYIKVTNDDGSTKDPPVTVEALVASDGGTILPERWKQLAQIITGSPPTENLGLNHSVFGKVKEISLSSFLNHSLHAPTPTPLPSPSMPPSNSPAFSPEPSAAPSPYNAPYYYLSPISDSHAPSDCGSTKPPSPSPTSHHDEISPNLSPQISPVPSPFPSGLGQRSGKGLVPPLHVSSSSTYAHSSFVAVGTWRIQRFYLNGLVALILLCWISTSS